MKKRTTLSHPLLKNLLESIWVNFFAFSLQIETNRNTALTLACFQGRTEVVGLLLDRKANVEHRAKVCISLHCQKSINILSPVKFIMAKL